MTSSVTSPSDIVNLSLARIGFKTRIGDLYEGSMQSKLALTVYSQTRDELLRLGDWGFAERNVAMTLLKQAPVNGYVGTVWSSIYPPLPWQYEYAYPSDALKVRSVKPTPIFVPVFDPQPYVFSVENDNSFNPPQKVVLCNVPSAILVYTGQVTDPTTWEADFVEALCSAIGRRLAPALSNLDAAKMEAQDEAQSTVMAEDEQG